MGSEKCPSDELVLTAKRAMTYKAEEPLDVKILLRRIDPVSNMDELVSGLDSEVEGELHANFEGAERFARLAGLAMPLSWKAETPSRPILCGARRKSSRFP